MTQWTQCFPGVVTVMQGNATTKPTTRCSCPAGMGPDLTLFHDDATCSLPTGVLAAGAVVSAFVVLGSGAVLADSARTAKASVARAHALCGVCLVSWFVQFVTLAGMGGFYAPSALALAVWAASLGLWLREALVVVSRPLTPFVVVDPLTTTTTTTTPSRRAAVTAAWVAWCVACGIALAVTAREPPIVHNAVTAGVVLGLVGAGLILVVRLDVTCGALLEVVQHCLTSSPRARPSVHAPKLADVRRRLSSLRVRFRVTFALLCSYVPIVTTHLVVGTCPFAWIVFVLAPLLLVLNALQASRVMSARPVESHQSGATTNGLVGFVGASTSTTPPGTATPVGSLHQ